ncbi:DMT family transporter [Rickettsiella endosymbiont of Aleochara curtula]|uniref:DMT family transporter n=1 Tax=Rickettsiella endosymbiont of Aleochara curtula TaxID=3077936 RepID=UPI00313DAE41
MEKKSLIAVVYMLTAVFFVSLTSVLVKWTSATYAITEIIFFRNAIAVIMCLGILSKKQIKYTSSHLKWHFLHAFLGLSAMFFFYTALSKLPIADVTATLFSVPLFVIIFSSILLKERVGFKDGSCVLVGLIGALMVVRSSASILQLNSIFALLSAIFTALALITIRYIGKYENSITTTFYYTLITTAALFPILPIHWTTPSEYDLLLLILLGIGDCLGQLLMTQSYRDAPSYLVAPLGYTSLIWTVLFGFIIWSEIPKSIAFVGVFLIIASTLSLISYQNKKK